MTLAAWAMLFVIWAGAMIALVYLRNAAFQQAQTDIVNLTRVIAAETEVVFRSSETILKEARQAVLAEPDLPTSRFLALLRRERTDNPFLRGLAVLDAEGGLHQTTLAERNGDGGPFEQRDWFVAARDAKTDTMAIGLPVYCATTASWIIPLALRMEAPDGRFLGVVATALDSRFFNTLFGEINLGSLSSINLHRTEGAILSRQPFDPTLLGYVTVNPEVRRLVQAHLVDVVIGHGIRSGEPRLIGTRAVEGYSAYVTVTLAQSLILKVWWAQTAIVMGGALVISILLFVTMRQSDARSRLSAEQDAAKTLLDSSPRALATLRRGEDGVFTVSWANRPFAALLGCRLDDIREKPFLPLLAGLSRMPVPALIEDRAGSRFQIEVQTPDGPVDAQFLLTPVKGQQRSFGTVLVTATSLTAERLANRQEADRHMLEALGRMSGRVAHEINNVLQPILSHASLALHAAEDNHRVEAHLHEIQNGVRNGREIVRSILTLAGAKATIRRPTSLELAVSEALALIRPSLPNHIALHLALHAPGALVPLAAGEMFQILSNLVGNAKDAMGEGGSILIQTARHDVEVMESSLLDIPAGAYFELLIKDSGPGMDGDTLRRAIDPFFTTKPFGKGSGLGLYTVRAILTNLGGSLEISSQPGKGTKVRVLFPAREML